MVIRSMILKSFNHHFRLLPIIKLGLVIICLLVRTHSVRPKVIEYSYLSVGMNKLPPEFGSAFDAQPIGDALLCLSCWDPNGVVIVNRFDFTRVARIPMAASPGFLCNNVPRSELYVLANERPAIFVLDTKLLQASRIITLPQGARPIQMAVTNSGTTAFVGDIAKPLIYVIDLRESKTIKQISLSAPAARIQLAEGLQKLYVGTQAVEDEKQQSHKLPDKLNANVDIIDVGRLERIGSITAPGMGVMGLAVSEHNKALYILSYRGAMLTAVKIDGKPSLKTVPPPTQMPGDGTKTGSGLLYDAHTDVLYACSRGLNGEWISVVSPQSFQVVNRVMGGSGRIGLWSSLDGKSSVLYAPDLSANILTTLNFGESK